MSDRNVEQRINIKFCVKIGRSACETLAVLQEAYGEHSMKRSSVFEWHRRFKRGREDVHDDPRSGQPKTQRTAANVDRVRSLVHSDQGLSLRTMAEKLKMNRETVRQILTEDLGMRKIVYRTAKNTKMDKWEAENANDSGKRCPLTTKSTKASAKTAPKKKIA